MSNSFPKQNDQIIWVVAKTNAWAIGHEWGVWPVVEDQGYWDKAAAERRVKHLRDNDNEEASVWPVRFWAPPAPVVALPVAPPPPPALTVGVVTTDQGMRLHAYAEDKRPRLVQPFGHASSQPPLAQFVSDAWTAWRQQQANQGNFDAAGQGQPSNTELAALYQET